MSELKWKSNSDQACECVRVIFFCVCVCMCSEFDQVEKIDVIFTCNCSYMTRYLRVDSTFSRVKFSTISNLFSHTFSTCGQTLIRIYILSICVEYETFKKGNQFHSVRFFQQKVLRPPCKWSLLSEGFHFYSRKVRFPNAQNSFYVNNKQLISTISSPLSSVTQL